MAEIRSNHTYMMPAHVGGTPGGYTAGVYHDGLGLTAFYQTDADALGALLPPAIASPGRRSWSP